MVIRTCISVVSRSSHCQIDLYALTKDLVPAEPWVAVDADEPKYYYFQQNTTSSSFPDTVRAEGVSYWEELIMARKGTNCTGIVACGSTYNGDLGNL
jgi:hypothetical protein